MKLDPAMVISLIALLFTADQWWMLRADRRERGSRSDLPIPHQGKAEQTLEVGEPERMAA
jgi:hypothetical protein